MRTICKSLAVVLCAVCASHILADDPPATQPDFAAIARNLASSDFAVREAAQKQLDALSPSARPALVLALSRMTDPEVKTRFAARLEALDRDLLIPLPPISLNIRNATIPELAAALSKATGTRILYSPGRTAMEGQAFYTLEAKDKPFWDVIRELWKQHPIQFDVGANSLHISQGILGTPEPQIQGAFAIFPLGVGRGPGNPPISVSIGALIAADPRLTVIRSSHVVTQALDEDDRNHADPHAEFPPAELNLTGQMFGFGLEFKLPEKRPSKITYARGAARFQIALTTDTQEIADAGNKLNTPIHFIDRNVMITELKAEEDKVRFAISLGRLKDELPVRIAIVDGEGKIIGGGFAQGNYVFRDLAAFRPPYKIILSAPARLQELTIPVELRDLILPR